MITRKELAKLYGVSRNTITRRLKELGISDGKMLNPKQVALVYEELGEPGGLEYLKRGEQCVQIG